MLSGIRSFPMDVDVSVCVFCVAPVVDGGIVLSEVDLDRLRRWWKSGTGEEVCENSIRNKRSCMNCAREARRLFELNDDGKDYAWWPMEDPFYEYYKRGWMRTCTVKLKRLTDEEIFSGLNLHPVKIKMELECDEIEFPLSTSAARSHEEIVVKVEKREHDEISTGKEEIGDEIPPPSPPKIPTIEAVSPVDTASQIQPTVVCFYCQEKGPRGTFFEQHMSCKTCESCKASFSCGGLLRKHIATCIKASEDLEVSDNSILLSLLEGVLERPNVDNAVTQPKVKAVDDFKCLFCVESFNLKAFFDEHMQKVHKSSTSGTFKCGTCDKNFIGILPLQSHLKIHKFESENKFELFFVEGDTTATVNPSGAKLMKCTFCSKLLNEAILARHILNMHASKPSEFENVKCQLCDFNADNDKSLREHHIKEHPDANQFQCQFCQTNFRFKTLFQYHVCRKKPKAICEVCGLEMYTEFMDAHKKVEGHADKNCNVFPQCQTMKKMHELCSIFCTVCKTKFCSLADLLVHTLLTHGQEEVTKLKGVCHAHLDIMCEKCNFYFPCEVSLSSHMNACHINPLLHACKFCGQLMGSLENLKYHFSAVHQLGESGYHCETCNLYFFLKTAYLRHTSKKSCHTPMIKAPEDLKVLAYFAKESRKNGRVYKRSKRIECSKCKQRFNNPNNFNNHMILCCNEGSIEKQCLVCNKEFDTNAHIHWHIYFDHLLDPKFKDQLAVDRILYCNFCRKSFKSHIYISHLETAHKEALVCRFSFQRYGRIYNCNYCPMKLQEKHEAREHFEKDHEGKLDTVCIYCRKYCHKMQDVTEHIKLVHAKENVSTSNPVDDTLTCYHCQKDVLASESLAHYKVHIKEALEVPVPHSTETEKPKLSDEIIMFDSDDDEDMDMDILDSSLKLGGGRKCDFCDEIVAPAEMVDHLTEKHAPKPVELEVPLAPILIIKPIIEESTPAPTLPKLPNHKIKVSCNHCGTVLLRCNFCRHSKVQNHPKGTSFTVLTQVVDTRVFCKVCGVPVASEKFAEHTKECKAMQVTAGAGLGLSGTLSEGAQPARRSLPKLLPKLAVRPSVSGQVTTAESCHKFIEQKEGKWKRICCWFCSKWMHPNSLARHILCSHPEEADKNNEAESKSQLEEESRVIYSSEDSAMLEDDSLDSISIKEEVFLDD
ncbi:uncharacterized protein LOC132200211 [Neocloeon triangulifer]|uniref:uncharacterized protein LOC132200211 n=1 Tax=Neocloeon triangulifer TaxID=2078957 RepID=UPI00286EF8F4|nr:uncharacterized protein LOC132200211 [Neocloeon triangulifer]